MKYNFYVVEYIHLQFVYFQGLLKAWGGEQGEPQNFFP